MTNFIGDTPGTVRAFHYRPRSSFFRRNWEIIFGIIGLAAQLACVCGFIHNHLKSGSADSFYGIFTNLAFVPVWLMGIARAISHRNRWL